MQFIRALAAGDDVASVAAVDQVITIAAIDDVPTSKTLEGLTTRTAIEDRAFGHAVPGTFVDLLALDQFTAALFGLNDAVDLDLVTPGLLNHVHQLGVSDVLR